MKLTSSFDDFKSLFINEVNMVYHLTAAILLYLLTNKRTNTTKNTNIALWEKKITIICETPISMLKKESETERTNKESG